MYKILIVNKFFYKRGGDCTYTMNLARLLEQQNHEIAIFAMQYHENINSGWDTYYPSEVVFSGGSLKSKILATSRLMGFAGVKSSFLKILDDFKPDIVHLNNIHSYLSPIIAKLAHNRGIKVVWTLHDYKLICPAYSCLRDGKVCELCFLEPLSVLMKKCMKRSWTASIMAYIEAKRWNRNQIEPYVDSFICPSSFMANKMKQAGYNEKKLNVLCNFIEFDKSRNACNQKADIREQAYCYIGRLSKEKGLKQLLEVATSLQYKLYIAGEGPLKDILEKKYACEKIIFLGKLDNDEVSRLLRHVQFSVLPSIWYENSPLSIIESLCMGTPVLAANIGGIPELINDENGLLFKPNNLNDLGDKIIYLLKKRSFNNEMIQTSSADRFSSKNYYNRLIEIYNDNK
ncbi:glycosyltransferase [uncultured Bacteroides sp.]|uniref:glycosyltransferase n=1 Tax=uncultured Bacteroides sp. TaxID=162156 RepID=UPI002AAB1524|nr:glycosyltransferase [uncultured Bacteroides sp.]